MRLAVLALVVGACGERDVPPTPTAGSAPVEDAAIDAGVVARPALAAPHGGTITVVAVADRADAALTADDTGELRFWPTLDGTREPVAIRARPPVALALVRERDGHLAALLDAAHGLELVHLTADGGVRGREVLPAEPGYAELAASATVLLARRTDHVLVRLDAGGRPRTLAPAQGEQVLALAARGDAAVAGIADPERPAEIHVVRELRTTGGLAWGRAFTLPVPLAAPIALSPSGQRVAGLHARNNTAVIVELGPQPRVVANDVAHTDPEAPALGFLDEARAVFRGGVVVSAPAVTVAADPWSGTRSTVRVRIGEGAVVADDAVIGGVGTHLAIASPERTQFLGYRDLGVGALRVTGEHSTLGFGNRVLWLDDDLAVLRTRDVTTDTSGALAVDAQHLLASKNTDGRLDLFLVDATTEREQLLGSWAPWSTVTYDPRTSVFAVLSFTTPIARAHLDVATAKVTPLRPLATRLDAIALPGRAVSVELLDPTRAGGAVAVAHAFGAGGLHVATFVDDGTSMHPLTARSTVEVRDAMFPIGTDERGTMYTLATAPDGRPRPVYAHAAGKQVRRLLVDSGAQGAAVDRAGTMLAVYSLAHVILYDIAGNERWRVPAWSVNIARFTADGETLLVNTQGGLVALDVATGARRAAGCGWGFGLSAIEPQLSVFVAPVVCAEPT